VYKIRQIDKPTVGQTDKPIFKEKPIKIQEKNNNKIERHIKIYCKKYNLIYQIDNPTEVQ
jgi:hypothetical protein